MVSEHASHFVNSEVSAETPRLVCRCVREVTAHTGARPRQPAAALAAQAEPYIRLINTATLYTPRVDTHNIWPFGSCLRSRSLRSTNRGNLD